MKKVLFYTAIALTAFSSFSPDARRISKEHTLPGPGVSKAITANAVPINVRETFPVNFTAWNDCTGELVDFSGTGHFHIRGMISDGKITFALHYNTSNVKGIGQTSGTRYVSSETFNYSNTDNFTNPSIIYQQRQTINYVALGSQNNMVVENDWHLTVNAIGEVAFFFTTEGFVVSCQ